MSKEEAKDIVIIGIGNSGRSDDGLGWLAIDSMGNNALHVDLRYRYQLQIEDAEEISHYKTVIFVDATKEVTESGFYFRPCAASMGIGLTSHMLEPETILWLENQLYQKNPDSYILGIEGEKWGMSVQPSDQALSNLNKALDFLQKNIHLILEHKEPCLV